MKNKTQIIEDLYSEAFEECFDEGYVDDVDTIPDAYRGQWFSPIEYTEDDDVVMSDGGYVFSRNW